MFGHFLLEQGLELELEAEMGEIMDFIDKDIPNFVCGDYGYNVSSGKGVLNSEWKLMVKPRELETSTIGKRPVGYLMVEKLNEYVTKFTIPPRVQWGQEGEGPTEQEAKLFSSFIFQTLNAFQNRGYIQLPGVLPVE